MAEFKQTVSGTVGSGMKSLFGGNGRTFYELQHKVSSAYHKAGEAQKIIVDQIKLGRDSKCQVRFDESFETVSREHAAIVRDGDNWKLIQLSKTNPTYLNGHPVANEWYLQTGDEIQLATNGPKLGFVVPTGKGSLIKSIGLTQRLPMFVNQALRPYKTAVTALVCILVLLICGGTWLAFDHAKQGNIIVEQQRTQDSLRRVEEQKIAELVAQNEEQKKAINKAQQKIEQQRRKQEELARRQDSIMRAAASQPQVAVVEPAVVSAQSVNQAVESCIPSVFFIQTTRIKITARNGRTEEVDCNEFGWTGTGFLLADGRFVTARHVVESWMYPEDSTDVLVNMIVSNGGKVEVWFEAISSTGKKFTFKNNQFKCKRSGDTRETLDDGTVIVHALDNPSDVAWAQVDDHSGLKADAALSNQLPRSTELKILGFPHGYGANSPTDITPISSTATTAAPGLQNGEILTTNSNIEGGNSGGPALVMNAQGQIVVVGVISAAEGRSLGFIVPISEIY